MFRTYEFLLLSARKKEYFNVNMLEIVLIMLYFPNQLRQNIA